MIRILLSCALSLCLFTLTLAPTVGCASAHFGNARMMTVAPRSAYADAVALRNESLASSVTSTKTTAPTAAPDRPAAARLMIYNATMHVTVERVADSLDAGQRIAKVLGGHLHAIQENVLVIKVPAAQLTDALAQLARLGEETRRDVQGIDVTEEMLDLNIRLQNAENAHTRLTALLEKAEKVEDILKIEKELQRITEEIERLKGRARYLHEHVAFSTVTVHFNASVPQDQIREQVPFQWVQQLATEFIAGTRPANVEKGWFKSGINVDTPKGYVKYYEDESETRTMSADGVLTHVTFHDNYPGGNVTFWTKLVRRTLVETRTIAITDEQSITLASGEAAVMLRGTKEIAGKPRHYLVVLSTTKDRIYTYEAWGPEKAFTAELDALSASVKTMRMR